MAEHKTGRGVDASLGEVLKSLGFRLERVQDVDAGDRVVLAPRPLGPVVGVVGVHAKDARVVAESTSVV